MKKVSPAPRVGAAPMGGTPSGWIAPTSWQVNQRLSVRGRRAWLKPAGADRLIELHRIDETDTIWEGLDGWGHPHVIGIVSQSVWLDPIGRKFPRLRDAIAAW